MINPDEKWFQIYMGTISGGIAILNGKITKAPPVFAWMIVKNIKDVKPYLLKEGATAVEIK